MAARVAQSDRGRMMDKDQHAWVEQDPLDNEEFVRITRGTMLRDLRQLPGRSWFAGTMFFCRVRSCP
jgi:hypothetical protein